MKYQLRANGGSREPVAEADLPDHFSAEQWAREWVKSAAGDDSYILQSAEGDFGRLVAKTKFGQCYFTPAMVEPGAA